MGVSFRIEQPRFVIFSEYLSIFSRFIIYLCVCACLSVSMCMYVGASGDQKGVSDPVELELHTGCCELPAVGSGN